MKKGEKILICPKCMKSIGEKAATLKANDTGYCKNCKLWIPKIALIKKFARYA